VARTIADLDWSAVRRRSRAVAWRRRAGRSRLPWATRVARATPKRLAMGSTGLADHECAVDRVTLGVVAVHTLSQRREGDSNPRGVAPLAVFKTVRGWDRRAHGSTGGPSLLRLRRCVGHQGTPGTSRAHPVLIPWRVAMLGTSRGNAVRRSALQRDRRRHLRFRSDGSYGGSVSHLPCGCGTPGYVLLCHT